jgi:S1-C subfamily serine protease
MERGLHMVLAKNARLVIGTLMLLATCLPAVAQSDSSKAMADLSAKYSGALALVGCNVDEEGQKGTMQAPGICISKEGIFLTTAINPRVRPESLKDFFIILPGNEGKKISAELRTLDPLTGISFVQAKEKREWTAVTFADTSNLKLGEQVYSLGLVPQPGSPVAVNTSYISTLLRVPDLLAYVGGNIGSPMSIVFLADGTAVGITGRQLPADYQLALPNGSTRAQLLSQDQCSYFTPVEEFVYLTKNIPSDRQVRRLGWIGVNKFDVLDKETADLMKLDKPGVKIDQVIEGYPAARAGLQNRDIIIGFNGKPLEKFASPNLTLSDFNRQLLRQPVGEKVKFTVQRPGGEVKDYEVVMEKMPTLPSEAKLYRDQGPIQGFLAREKVLLDRYLSEDANKDVDGLIVVAVQKGSPAAAAGLKEGDIIVSANKKDVKTVEDIKKVFDDAKDKKPADSVTLEVKNGNLPKANIVLVPQSGANK